MNTRLILIVGLLVVAGVAGAAVYRAANGPTADQAMADQGTVRAMGLVEPAAKHLATAFKPDGDTLLAAPPADPAQLRDPPQIVFAHLDSPDPDSRDATDVDWHAVERHLSAAVGRPVVDVVYDNSPEQLTAIRGGRITVVALHAADAPFLVNQYGFRPVGVLGTAGKGASGNRLDIIVPAASAIRGPGDLRGHTLTCTVPSSVTGYRAAVALLVRDHGLQPNVDYFITWSLKQKASIEGVADGKYDAATVSDDKLQSMVETGSVAAGDVRQVYQSDVVPRTTVGTFCDLKPAPAAKVAAALLAYAPPSAGNDRFLPIDYRRDFALVREIDDRFDPRLSVRSATPTTAPTAP